MSDAPKSQAEKFEELARELECDDDPEAFKKIVQKIAPTKPEPPADPSSAHAG